MPARSEAATPSLARFVGYFLRLGATGFGGPVALSARMQRDLVEQRGWVERDAFLEGLALAQLAPGPLAAQLAIYLGWLRAGVSGATLVGAAFVLPSLVIVLGLAWGYVRLGGMPWMQAVFYGLGPAAIAVMARGSWKMARATLRADIALWIVCAINAVATTITERESVAFFVASGAAMVVWRRALPTFRLGSMQGVAPLLLPAAGHAATGAPPLFEIATFFASAGLFVFGSGLAIVPFLRGGVVGDHHWLTESQFLDAVAVAMITPGPVVITVAFIGYLIARLPGALAAAIAVFVPCWLVVILLAPAYRRLSGNRALSALVAGVTAASCGALIGATVVLGRRSIRDPATLVLAAAALVVLIRWRRVPEPVVLVAAAGAGLMLSRR